MSQAKGLLIVIDGADGAGKSTQYARLVERFQKEQLPFSTIKFPRYGHPSAYFVEEYLQGAYGPAMQVPAKRACLFYALERYAASFEMHQLMEQGTTILADRYITANMAFNGAKITDAAERKELYHWISQTEYDTLGIPKADLDIILSVTPKQAERNIINRVTQDNVQRDTIEQDPTLLRRSHDIYKELIRLFPDQHHEINCMNQGANSMRSAEEIHGDIWELILKYI